MIKMTIEEAIKHCNEVAGGALCEGTVNHKACGEEHRQLALWLQDYKTLKDKATPKLPGFNIIHDNWVCPCCEAEYETDYEEYDYCPGCGQAILWEDKQ